MSIISYIWYVTIGEMNCEVRVHEIISQVPTLVKDEDANNEDDENIMVDEDEREEGELSDHNDDKVENTMLNVSLEVKTKTNIVTVEDLEWIIVLKERG